MPAVITSIGAVTAHGAGAARLFSALLEGRSAIGPVTRFSTEGLCSGLAAEVPDGASGPRSPHSDRASALLAIAAAEALADRPLAPSSRRGVLVGTTKGALERLSDPGPVDLLGAPARALAGLAGARGPVHTVGGACSSSALALGQALELVEAGTCDEVVVGGVEALHAFVFQGFHALRALSPRPARPFDRDRSGLTLGEGAAVLVVESAAHARREGRRPLAVLEGAGAASDGHDQVAPEPGGRGLRAAAVRALASAGVGADAIGAYLAHGTGTLHNERMEAAVVTALFAGRPVPVTAIKGSVGHTLGAAGALDAVVAVLALARRLLPPVTNLAHVDRAAAVEAVLCVPRPLERPRLLLGSAGFGGIDAALVLAASEAAR